MNDNLTIDLLSKRLDLINDKCLKKISKIEKNFNELKDTFYELTKQNENNKKIIDNNDTNKNYDDDNNINAQLSSLLTQLLSEERNNNINYINSCLNKYNLNQSILNYNEQNSMKEYVEIFENELKQIITKIDEKIENIKMEKTNNIQVINIEMNNEINNLIKKMNDTSLDLILSNSDKANAIQDIINIYLNKFKVSKSEFDEFEDKITKLISELLDKVILLRKGQ